MVELKRKSTTCYNAFNNDDYSIAASTFVLEVTVCTRY